jgi:hypothetical protein
MFQKLLEDVRDTTGGALRLTSLAAAVAVSLLITVSFLCAAAFVYVQQTYGTLPACLAGAGVFLAAAVIAAIVYAALKRKMQREAAARAAARAKATMDAAITNPMLLAAGLQAARSLGVKRLIPLVAIGAIGLGLLASRGQPRPPEESSDES